MKNIFLSGKMKELREAKDLSPEKLAKLTHGAVNKQMIYKYEDGVNEPSYSKIVAIAKALEVPAGILFETYSESSKMIPVFHMAGAGPPRLSSGEVVATVTLPDGFYRLGIIPVKVFGNSMEPVMLDGAIVGVDLHNREYISGKYYAVWLDDQGAVIKKLSSEPGKVFVESLNKNEHSFYIDREVIEDHFILGRVVWWINQDTGK